MRLHDIKPRPGAKHRRKRLGNGESSGLGKPVAEDTRVKNLDQVVDQDPHLREGKCLFIVDCQKEVSTMLDLKKSMLL